MTIPKSIGERLCLRMTSQKQSWQRGRIWLRLLEVWDWVRTKVWITPLLSMSSFTSSFTPCLFYTGSLPLSTTMSFLMCPPPATLESPVNAADVFEHLAVEGFVLLSFSHTTPLHLIITTTIILGGKTEKWLAQRHYVFVCFKLRAPGLWIDLQLLVISLLCR